ncbi:hypothetical protein C7M84_019919 [Penaeus vannamei]|uniref:Uncharacterized protein n=1 Tax=Penaeus vannamei TaxID=6689 RepID=A0A3R7LR66_PENVA|nr:hypothetical protein C7M84_019919 [Penaeus vannamei]
MSGPPGGREDEVYDDDRYFDHGNSHMQNRNAGQGHYYQETGDYCRTREDDAGGEDYEDNYYQNQHPEGRGYRQGRETDANEFEERDENGDDYEENEEFEDDGEPVDCNVAVENDEEYEVVEDDEYEVVQEDAEYEVVRDDEYGEYEVVQDRSSDCGGSEGQVRGYSSDESEEENEPEHCENEVYEHRTRDVDREGEENDVRNKEAQEEEEEEQEERIEESDEEPMENDVEADDEQSVEDEHPNDNDREVYEDEGERETIEREEEGEDMDQVNKVKIKKEAICEDEAMSDEEYGDYDNFLPLQCLETSMETPKDELPIAPPPEEKLFTCKCEEKFSNKKGLKSHTMKYHTSVSASRPRPRLTANGHQTRTSLGSSSLSNIGLKAKTKSFPTSSQLLRHAQKLGFSFDNREERKAFSPKSEPEDDDEPETYEEDGPGGPSIYIRVKEEDTDIDQEEIYCE